MDSILLSTYKRTRDGYYIFTNIHDIINILQWRSIEGFIRYMEEEAHVLIYKDDEYNIYYINEVANINEMNTFLKKEYNKYKSRTPGII